MGHTLTPGLRYGWLVGGCVRLLFDFNYSLKAVTVNENWWLSRQYWIGVPTLLFAVCCRLFVEAVHLSSVVVVTVLGCYDAFFVPWSVSRLFRLPRAAGYLFT